MINTKKYRSEMVLRAHFALIGVILLLTGLIFRLYWLQIANHKRYQKKALRQHWCKKNLQARRGEIRSRNGSILAISLEGHSCYADPKMVKKPKETAKHLEKFLHMSQEKLLVRLSNTKRRFVWLKRLLSKEVAEKIKSLKLKGIYFRKEPRRVYPHGKKAAQVIGFVGLEHKGLEGIEASFQKELMGQNGFTWILKDGRMAKSKIYSPYAPSLSPVNGASVYLTIDEVYQYFAEVELDKVIEKFKPQGAAIVMLDVKTADVLAMASRPTYDPNKFGEFSTKSWRNRALCDAYELGSVMKPLVIAAALSQKVVRLNTIIDCGRGWCRIIPGRILRDTHAYGKATVEKVIIKSSNIGSAKIGMMLGEKKLFSYLCHLGFGKKTGIELPGETIGILKPLKKWDGFTLTSVPMGHEICITPLQMTAAYLPLCGDGIYRPPSIIKKIVFPDGSVANRYQPTGLTRVYSEKVIEMMRKVLRKVVVEGTAKRANIKGVAIGGKTGTAQKLVNGKYSHSKHIGVFVGFAPANNPVFCALAMVDEPKGASYGGTVAAPAVAQLLKKSLINRSLRRQNE